MKIDTIPPKNDYYFESTCPVCSRITRYSEMNYHEYWGLMVSNTRPCNECQKIQAERATVSDTGLQSNPVPTVLSLTGLVKSLFKRSYGS